MHQTHRAAVTAIIVGVLSTLILSTPSEPASAADTCEPVAVLAFRGSGEKNIISTEESNAGSPIAYRPSALVTNGWEGKPLRRLFQSFAPITYADGFKADSVPVIGIGPKDDQVSSGYPAIEAYREVFSDLNDSAAEGALAALQKMKQFQRQQPAGCARTKFVLAGYSQGAIVARWVAQANPADTLGVVDIGDPYQKPNGAGNEGSKPSGNGFMRWNYPQTADESDKFYDLPLARAAICHDGDPICDFRWGTSGKFFTGDFVDHESYYTSAYPEEAERKSRQIADLAHDAWKRAQTAEPKPAAVVDVVFSIDTTGSMQPYISQAVATAESVARSTLARSPGSRVSLVEFRDHGDEFVARTVVPLTEDFTALTNGLQTLVADGGGDFPEAVYSGIVEAASQEWRSGVARSIVLIGDAPPHDPEQVTGYTAASVTSILRGTVAAPPIAEGRFAAAALEEAATETSPIVLYSASADPELTAALQPIVTDTGGLSFAIDDTGGLDDALRLALEDSVSAPVASIGVPTPVIAGIQTFVSATGSLSDDAALSAAFDLDGDGVYETPAVDGTASVTFPSAGDYLVQVTVTDSRGRSSTAADTVTVLAAEAAQPAFDPDAPELTVTAPTEATRGSSIPVQVSGGTPLEYLLVAGSGTDNVWVEPVSALTVPNEWATAGLLIPESVPAGDYRLVIGSDPGLWGLTQVEVIDPTGTGAPDPTPVPGTVPQQPTGSGAAPAAVDRASIDTARANSSRNELAATGPDRTLAPAGAVLLTLGVSLLLLRRRRSSAAESP